MGKHVLDWVQTAAFTAIFIPYTSYVKTTIALSSTPENFNIYFPSFFYICVAHPFVLICREPINVAVESNIYFSIQQLQVSALKANHRQAVHKVKDLV